MPLSKSASPRITLVLDGTDYPVSIEETTARQAGELALYFAVDPLQIRERLVGQEIDVLDAAALAWLSLRQQGHDPDPDALLDSITIGTSCEVRIEEPIAPDIGLDADPES